MNPSEAIKERHPEIDLEALRDKYRVERDRRLRTDGEEQYVEVSGKHAHYGEDDPYSPEIKDRAPITDEVEVLIVGGGWGGLVTAARLKQAGVQDVRIVEAGGDFGGTWYWNRYPGCQCDVDAYIYLPLLEETNYVPTMKYAYAPEIYEHARRIAKTFGLYDNACLQTRVREMRWNEDAGRWFVTTNRGDEFKARYTVIATGPVSRPKLPGLPGLDDFQGKIFHTSRWDYEYTGGDHSGNLDKLGDKTVAVIGTGGTAIQCVSHLGQSAKRLYVFQRTPSSVDLRLNKPTDPEWKESLKPGWQAERQRNFDDVCAGKNVPDLVDDAFTSIFKSVRLFMPTEGVESLSLDEIKLISELSDAYTMNGKRARVDAEVKDPKVAELMKPWYRLLCKRPTFNDDYLATFNRPNVTLVDTTGSHGVERLTKDGIVANGIEYKVDCIVSATGFEVSSSYRRRIGFEIFGRNGESLYDHWADGLRTFHGWGSHGFPNWFFIGTSQNGLSFNYTSTTTVQATHVASIIKQARERGATRIEPTVDAVDEWVSEIDRLCAAQWEFFEACTPGYYNNEGQANKRKQSLAAVTYGPGPNAFEDVIVEWRNANKLEGLIVT
ncbi:4-hydroxyacetophenone monooxygenase [Pandoraea terrae]|uniref:4-hydroxyacetophenone monooxygenase n=1 Tax=Pandoraea terrae TaxID=1537710 RepID=A0A5E4U329_9BURK|nr:NAD(P)/FAD-dependent oxidoreductase [Pandoraea terrae]VVD94556.1 4-hydroxyacetophenone monooxygenase [Pandoraea terrae]